MCLCGRHRETRGTYFTWGRVRSPSSWPMVENPATIARYDGLRIDGVCARPIRQRQGMNLMACFIYSRTQSTSVWHELSPECLTVRVTPRARFRGPFSRLLRMQERTAIVLCDFSNAESPQRGGCVLSLLPHSMPAAKKPEPPPPPPFATETWL